MKLAHQVNKSYTHCDGVSHPACSHTKFSSKVIYTTTTTTAHAHRMKHDSEEYTRCARALTNSMFRPKSTSSSHIIINIHTHTGVVVVVVAHSRQIVAAHTLRVKLC